MLNDHYELRALPLFKDDLNEIVDYIAFTLHNPIAQKPLSARWKKRFMSG